MPSYLSKHRGSGTDVAEAPGTETAGLRPLMRDLIEEQRVKTKGKAWGIRCSAV